MIHKCAPYKLTLLLGTAMLPCSVLAQTVASPVPATQVAATQVAAADDADTIVVTGQTTRNRAIITASADITVASTADIERKAPKSVADLLELVPGIFVEGTAGAVSNNYSVRGLQGGGQQFITLEEDGLPIVYEGGGADKYFAHDITINRLEAVRGGSSGILTVNGAAATINFISKAPNFKETEAIARVGFQTYGEKRADFYYSQPLAEDLAFNIGGYISSSPGVRKNPFNYTTYHVKAAIEKRWADGGYIRLTAKIGDQQDAYYADQPYRRSSDGSVQSVAGFDSKFGNIAGTAFGDIELPVSTFVSSTGLRSFRLSKGVEAKTKQVRVDLYKPIGDQFNLFAKVRYLDRKWDFNGLFPGSAGGNGSLTSAVNYLTPSASPLGGFLARGQVAFPTATQFGIKDLTSGRILAASDTASLNALNGNGLLQQTTLNHDYQAGTDFGSNFGGQWEYEGGAFKNSLTVGAMYYDTRNFQNQSATSTLVNDVRNDSHIYDVVALDASRNVVGTLTDNGVISYGNWGAGINRAVNKSLSFYFNDEVKIGENLHIDFGVRHESLKATRLSGNTAAVNQPVPPGTAGLSQDVGSTWDGTYTVTKKTQNRTAWTVGANYLIMPELSVYARYAKGFQTRGVDDPVDVVLYEAGVRYQGHGLTASGTVFRTEFDNQGYNFIDPADATRRPAFQADLRTNGFEIDLSYKPVSFFLVDFSGVFQKPKLTNAKIRSDENKPFVRVPQYDSNLPERTPKTLYTISPTVILPNGLGEIYGRYKYVGKIFADAGNGLALPSYGVTSAGVSINVSRQLTVAASVDNIFGVTGLTEGNPRDGQTQSTSVASLFYARGIVGTTAAFSATLKF